MSRRRILLAVFVSALCAAPAGASVKEARVTRVSPREIILDRGRDAGVRPGTGCDVFVEVQLGARRKLVQVARCRVQSVDARSATASLSDQQGSVKAGYVVRVETDAAERAASVSVRGKSVAAKKKPEPANAAASVAREPAVKPAKARAPEVAASAPSPAQPPGPAAASPSQPQATAMAARRAELAVTTKLFSHRDFHAAAERFLEVAKRDATAARGVLYEATLQGRTVDVGPQDELAGLAAVSEYLHFPGSWHTCFPRSETGQCALHIRLDESVYVRVDERAYGQLRSAIRSREVELRLVFTIRSVERKPVPEFFPADCPAGQQPYERATWAYTIEIDVAGGVMRAPHKGLSLLLLKSAADTDGLEVRLLEAFERVVQPLLDSGSPGRGGPVPPRK
jgi:hypothetical protein